MRLKIWLVPALLLGLVGYWVLTGKEALRSPAPGPLPTPILKEASVTEKLDKVVKTDAEWKKTLSPEQYEILRKKGTERAFTGKYWDFHGTGEYVCAACGYRLFRSEDKFDSHCGWPSFSQPVDGKAVETQVDKSHFMVRTEVHCPRCGGHLGHVFEDGPAPTGLRYCINSASIEFKEEKPKK